MKNSTRKSILTLIALILIIPNIVSVGVLINQSQIDKIAAEVASMRMDSFAETGRITAPRLEGTRLVDLTVFEEPIDKIYADDDVIMVADVPDVAETQEAGYVWSFASGGSLDTHKVYLTFDDGPSSRTDDILDILDEYGVKATFFVFKIRRFLNFKLTSRTKRKSNLQKKKFYPSKKNIPMQHVMNLQKFSVVLSKLFSVVLKTIMFAAVSIQL